MSHRKEPRKRSSAPGRELSFDEATDRMLQHLMSRAGLPDGWTYAAKRRTLDRVLRDTVQGCICGGSPGRNSIQLFHRIHSAYYTVFQGLKRGKFTQSESAVAIGLLLAVLDYEALQRGAAAVQTSKQQQQR